MTGKHLPDCRGRCAVSMQSEYLIYIHKIIPNKPMKKLIAISLIAISATNALAALQPWEDPRVNEVGREPMHAAF